MRSDFDHRRVEITGPVDRKMIINILKTGANVFITDLEDSITPTWENVLLCSSVSNYIWSQGCLVGGWEGVGK